MRQKIRVNKLSCVVLASHQPTLDPSGATVKWRVAGNEIADGFEIHKANSCFDLFMRNNFAAIRLFFAFTQGGEEFNLRANIAEFHIGGQPVEQIEDQLFVAHKDKLVEMKFSASCGYIQGGQTPEWGCCLSWQKCGCTGSRHARGPFKNIIRYLGDFHLSG